MNRAVFAWLAILCLLSVSSTAGFIRVVKADSGTIYIRANGSVDPPTAPISTIDNVTYTLTGNITSDADGIVIERDNIVVDGAGYTVQGIGGPYMPVGVSLTGRTNDTVENVNVNGFGNGIELRFCSNITVSENIVESYRHDVGYGTTYGVLLSETSRTFASQNNITRNDYGILILGSSSYNVICENSITNNTEGIVILSGPSDNAIVENEIAHSFRGIMMNEPGENNVFSKNKITDSDNAIWALKTSNNTFSENHMTNPRGFYFHQCNYNEFHGNEISGDIGIWLRYSSHNVIYENNMNNSHVQLDDSFGNTFYTNNMTKCGVTLVSSSNNSISENHMSAISLWQSSCNNILGNSVIGNDQYGIRLSESSGNILENNKMVDNHYNFYIYGETASDFANDIDTSNTVDGRPIYYWIDKRDSTVPSDAGYVALINCTSITVKNQGLVGNGQGILLINTTDSTVIKNSITDNLEGIRLSWSSANSISENSIVTNEYGVALKNSSNNKLHHNNFIDNLEQVFVENSSVNVWDDGLEGNYWSDYNGTDANHDGIGDTPYIIDANNTDNYPLMGKFYTTNVTFLPGSTVTLISNSTISIFQVATVIESIETSEDIQTVFISFTDEAGFGFCRVSIPHALMNVSGAPVIIDRGSTPVLAANYMLYDNGTQRWIYFAYEQAPPPANQTGHFPARIMIVPEFPSLLILPLFFIATLLAVIFHKRKHASLLREMSPKGQEYLTDRSI
jgi:parallel beta-helix repeat protein